MSDQELYDIARRKIDQRNRRWTIWGVDLVILVLLLAALIFLSETFYVNIAAAVFMAWGGVFTLHTIVTAMAHSRDNDIEGEIAKLRDAVSTYEKPKRLELSDDGELVEHDDWEVEDVRRTSQS